MHICSGTIIKSTSLLTETVFDNTLIFIISNNSDGAIGFIINQPADRNLNHLEEFKNVKSFALFKGGPVDEEHLFFIHGRPDLITDGQLVSNAIYHGGNFTEVISAINNGTMKDNELKIFIGYCGWDAGELEAEIEEGSWTTANNVSLFKVS